MTDEEKNNIELDIEAKYAGRTEKEFLNNITYVECLYILDTKNKYCDDIKNLSLLKIVDIVNEQSKEIEELKGKNNGLEIKANELYNLADVVKRDYIHKDKIKAKIEEFKIVRDTILENEKEFNRPMMIYDLKRNDYCEKMLQSLLEKE